MYLNLNKKKTQQRGPETQVLKAQFRSVKIKNAHAVYKAVIEVRNQSPCNYVCFS